jgi:hypothetical protein
MRRAWVLVAIVIATGIAGTAVALRDREGNAQFTAEQSGLKPISGEGIENIILTTSDPRPGYAGKARSARCRAGSDSPLGNPWVCIARYPRLPRVRYRVLVRGDGSIFGQGQPEGAPLKGVLTVRGCCVNTS